MAENLQAFIEDNALGKSAQKLLREQPEGVLESVIGEGPLKGPDSVALISFRIRKAEQTQALVPQIEAFIEANDLDQSAADALRSASTQVAQKVLAKKVHKNHANASALVMVLLRQARDAVAAEALEYTDEGFDVDAFFEQHPEIEDSAAEALRAQAPDVIRAVICRGGFACANPSGYLISQIRQVKQGQYQRRRAQTGKGYETLEEFLKENPVDKRAMESLCSQAEGIIRYVMEEGPLVRRNPSSEIMARIRQAQEEGDGDAPGSMKKKEMTAEDLVLQAMLADFLNAAWDMTVTDAAFRTLFKKVAAARAATREDITIEAPPAKKQKTEEKDDWDEQDADWPEDEEAWVEQQAQLLAKKAVAKKKKKKAQVWTEEAKAEPSPEATNDADAKETSKKPWDCLKCGQENRQRLEPDCEFCNPRAIKVEDVAQADAPKVVEEDEDVWPEDWQDELPKANE